MKWWGWQTSALIDFATVCPSLIWNIRAKAFPNVEVKYWCRRLGRSFGYAEYDILRYCTTGEESGGWFSCSFATFAWLNLMSRHVVLKLLWPSVQLLNIYLKIHLNEQCCWSRKYSFRHLQMILLLQSCRKSCMQITSALHGSVSCHF